MEDAFITAVQPKRSQKQTISTPQPANTGCTAHNKPEEGSWMFPEALGAFSSLWECRAEGKQRLEREPSPDLAPELGVLQFRRSRIFQQPQRLFQDRQAHVTTRPANPRLRAPGANWQV